MTASPTGGWAFAGPTFNDRAELHTLQVKRMKAYEDAADVEAMLLQENGSSSVEQMMMLFALKDHYYEEAARIEAEIERISKQGVNNDTEDDSSD